MNTPDGRESPMSTYETRVKHGLALEDRVFKGIPENLARQGLTILHMAPNSPYPDIIIIYRHHGVTMIIGVECKNWSGGYPMTGGHVWNLMVPKFRTGTVDYFERIVLVGNRLPSTKSADRLLAEETIRVMTLTELIGHLRDAFHSFSLMPIPGNLSHNNSREESGIKITYPTRPDLIVRQRPTSAVGRKSHPPPERSSNQVGQKKGTHPTDRKHRYPGDVTIDQPEEGNW